MSDQLPPSRRAEIRARLLGQAEYMDTGGPHGGVPASVETDSPVWRTAIDLLREAAVECDRLAASLAERERELAETGEAVSEMARGAHDFADRAEAAEAEVHRLSQVIERVRAAVNGYYTNDGKVDALAAFRAIRAVEAALTAPAGVRAEQKDQER